MCMPRQYGSRKYCLPMRQTLRPFGYGKRSPLRTEAQPPAQAPTSARRILLHSFPVYLLWLQLLLILSVATIKSNLVKQVRAICDAKSGKLIVYPNVYPETSSWHAPPQVLARCTMICCATAAFEVDVRYHNLKPIGRGAYGLVASADDLVCALARKAAGQLRRSQC